MIDYGNGAAYTLSPAEVTATLQPLEATAALRNGAQTVAVDRDGMFLAMITLE